MFLCSGKIIVACSLLQAEVLRRSSPGTGNGAGQQAVSVEAKVIACSPFLEAFGNACTPMNDNSSRFGKFLKIYFDRGVMVGGKMEHYLLEKARVAKQVKTAIFPQVQCPLCASTCVCRAVRSSSLAH